MSRTTTVAEDEPLGHLDNDDLIIFYEIDCFIEGREEDPFYLNNLRNWDKIMSRKTYRIELKMDFNDDSNHAILLGIAKQYTRDLLASAMLLQDKSKPAAALMTDDSFHGTDTIDLLEPSEQIHGPAVAAK